MNGNELPARAGLGLRERHIDQILSDLPEIAWFEVLADNYFDADEDRLAKVEALREHYPMTLHSVGLSIGSTDPLNQDYLKYLKFLIDRFQPTLVSEHLCWTSVHDIHVHDLLPLPYTEETVKHVANRISQVQDLLGRQVLIENVSSYLSYKHSTMTEWGFVTAIAEAADCHILLDVNNVYVSSFNHGFNAEEYIKGMPADRVKELHLAGGEERDGFLLDTHGSQVWPEVWQLYNFTLQHLGPTPTLLEWDNDIPDLSVIFSEMYQANGYIEGLAA